MRRPPGVICILAGALRAPLFNKEAYYANYYQVYSKVNTTITVL
jgi:hypothetical protein